MGTDGQLSALECLLVSANTEPRVTRLDSVAAL